MFEPVLFENFADLDRTFAVFDQMRRRMDAFLRESERAGYEPRFSMDDRGDAYVLEAELPGVTAETLELTLTGPVLKLRARREVNVPEGFVAHRRERLAYDLARSITLPTRVDAEQVTAEARDGIITVVLPKAAEARPRSIPVKVL
jgi:HSP20 family protein